MWKCQRCYGSGIDPRKFTGRSGWAVRSVASDAWTLSHKDPLEAMRRAERKASYGRLVLPESYVPAYPNSKSLRALVPEVPAGSTFAGKPGFNAFKSAWDKAAGHVRAHFLCCYAYEVAKKALPLVGQAGGDHDPRIDAERLDLKTMLLNAPTVDATELSAFPEDWGGKWVFVQGVYKGTDQEFSGRDRTAFEIATRLPHNLHLYTYLPVAKRFHEVGASEAHAPPFLKAIALKYPYDTLSRATKELKAGDHIRFLGRALVRKDRNPETSLEVWDIQSFVDELTRQRMALIRKPVTFRFEETPLSEALYFLSLLTGTKIRVEVQNVAALTVCGRIASRPLAEGLNTLIGDMKLHWVFDDKSSGLKVVQTASEQELTDRGQVLKHMK